MNELIHPSIIYWFTPQQGFRDLEPRHGCTPSLPPVTSTPPVTLTFTSRVTLESLTGFLHMHGPGVWEAEGGPQRTCADAERTRGNGVGG